MAKTTGRKRTVTARASRASNGTGSDEIFDGYQRIDKFEPESVERIGELYGDILKAIGEDPEREGLKRTPERVAKSLQYLTHGYDLDPAAILRKALFKEDYSQMVVVKDIEVYSLCEHHMLPFFGKAHVAYIPNGQITGLSKIPRVVDAFARRLQVQERLTNEIRDCIQDTLKPMGVAVVIEASHLCMQMRGIQKQNSVTTTSAFTGIFLDDHRTREEFIKLISAKLH
ncbi:MAG: GTP cyclohydrolase I FolE [Flavobacteriales bacterium]|nr:GTP cyclohydrolase I FolE [Flavobacteriales bacterium]